MFGFFRGCYVPNPEGYCGGGFMNQSNQPVLRFPQGHCVFCTSRTPHVHERFAVNGKQVVRSLCLVCNKEQPKEKSEA